MTHIHKYSRMALALLVVVVPMGAFAACWFSIAHEQCTPNIQVQNPCTNAANCLAQHSMQNTWCDRRDDPPCGNEDCTNQVKITTIRQNQGNCVNGTCHTDPINWVNVGSATCSEAKVFGGECGACPG